MVPSFSDLSAWRATFRRFGRERGFCATVVLTLGLCLGANLAIFAVVDAILLRPLPFPAADRLVTVFNAYPGAGVERAGNSLANYYERRGSIEAFASCAAYQGGSAIVGEEGSPRRVKRDRVSPEFFATLGAPLRMGRTFTEDELDYENSGVAILTHGFWQRYFNGDPEVLGREFTVDGFVIRVIGVLPEGFRYLSSEAQFYVPLASDLADRAADRRHSNNLSFVARLADGASLAGAQAQLDAFNASVLESDPYASLVRDAGFHTVVKWLHADHIEEIRTTLLLLQGGVLALLLIGGVNLVNLLLVRSSGRAKDLAVRQALGAGRGHIAREVLFELLLLSFAGGLLGLGLGFLGLRLLELLGASQLPLGGTIGLDGRVAIVGLCGALVVGIVLSLPVIWFSLRRDLGHALHSESRTGTANRASQRLRHGFIVTQISLAFVLLTGAGLLGLSLHRVQSVSPGFEIEQVHTASLALPWKNYPEGSDRLAFLDRLLPALEAIPGVTSVGISSALPFSGSSDNNAITVKGVEARTGESIRAHYTSAVAGDYFRTLGIPLLAGRYLNEADLRSEARVCLVDEVVARRYWPAESPLGHRVCREPVYNEDEAYTVVGVVGSVKQLDLSEAEPLGALYFPYQHYSSSYFSIAVRSTLAPVAVQRSLPQAVLALDPLLPLDDVRSMRDRIDDTLVARRSPAILAGIFAGVALLLAAVGTYGVVAYAVAQRQREIGVRMALGALPGQIRGSFLLAGVRLMIGGAAFGVLGGWVLGRGMRSLLFGLSGSSAALFALVAGLLFVVVLFASFIPSHRAARLTPLEALRDE